MIKASDAIAAARALIGTPYSELDCINLIKKIIRTAPGGVKGYQTAGTASLWASGGLAPGNKVPRPHGALRDDFRRKIGHARL